MSGARGGAQAVSRRTRSQQEADDVHLPALFGAGEEEEEDLSKFFSSGEDSELSLPSSIFSFPSNRDSLASRTPPQNTGVQGQQSDFAWLLSDDEDEGFSPAPSDEEDEDDEEEEESDEESDLGVRRVGRAELEHLQSDLQCPGMTPEQVRTTAGLIKRLVDRLLIVMLSSAAQGSVEPMQLCARVLEDVVEMVEKMERDSLTTPWRTIDTEAIKQTLDQLKRLIALASDTGAIQRQVADGMLSRMGLSPTEQRKPQLTRLTWYPDEMKLLHLGLTRFMDPAQLGPPIVIPRALRAQLLPHRTLLAIEQAVQRCVQKAGVAAGGQSVKYQSKSAGESAVISWCRDCGHDFTANDDARLRKAFAELKGDFALISRTHFPHRSQFQLRHRARQLNLTSLG